MKPRSSLLAVSLLTVAAAALVACGPSQDNMSSPPLTPTTNRVDQTATNLPPADGSVTPTPKVP